MTRRAKKGLLLSVLCSIMMPAVSVASAAEGSAAPEAAAATSLAARVDRIEAQLTQVQAEVAQLKSEKQAVQADLDSQKQEAASLKAQLAQAAKAPPAAQAKSTQVAADDSRDPAPPSTQWGTRLGWQGFPFGQEGGGFYYGFFLDHRLVSQAEGIPFGDFDVEVALGIARSGSDHLIVTSDVLGGPVKSEFRQTILSIEPGLKYYFNRWAPSGVRPYIVGGPGVWADIVGTPPLFIGENPPAKELAARKLPVDGSADVFEGVHGGAGLALSLARTQLPIIENMNLGFDYRYVAWTTGQRFSTYAFSLSYSD
jgi:hypothetical protein